jgi:ATP-dependent Clp protease ATP-binding subunit ClpX
LFLFFKNVSRKVPAFSDMLQIAVTGPGNPLGPSVGQQQQQQDEPKRSDILDNNNLELRLEKSNILMLGPTGSGESETDVCYLFFVS